MFNLFTAIEQVSLGVLSYLKADWPILVLGTIVAALFQVYLDVNALRRFSQEKTAVSLGGAVAVATLTPLCACGTMAVVISMLVANIPWAPLIAFLVASPLASPADYVFNAGFFGHPFAIASVGTAIGLGLIAGMITQRLQRTSFFDNQLRPLPSTPCTCSEQKVVRFGRRETFAARYKLKELLVACYTLGVKRILPYFVIFLTIGQIIQLIIPQTLILNLFSGNSAFSVPLAALIGMPVYVSGPTALPLLRVFVSQGADIGAVLAFLVAGKAVSIPVIMGMSTIIRPKVLLAYVVFVFVGSVISGYLYSFLF